MRIQQIAVMTDFSRGARSAYKVAASLASQTRSKLDIVHALRTPLPLEIYSALLGDQLHALRRSAVRQLEHDVSTIQHDDIACSVLDGQDIESIITYLDERSVDLIVQSSHGRSGVGRLVLGSFAEGLVRHSPVPVLTVKGDSHTGFNPRAILFPYDFSDVSLHALTAVRYLAEAFEANVTVFHAVEDLQQLHLEVGGEPIQDELNAVIDDVLSRVSAEMKTRLGDSLSGLEVEYVVGQGRAARAIDEVASASKADLICMSSHGYSGLRRLALGSVAAKTLRLATCPVWTVRVPPALLR